MRTAINSDLRFVHALILLTVYLSPSSSRPIDQCRIAQAEVSAIQSWSLNVACPARPQALSRPPTRLPGSPHRLQDTPRRLPGIPRVTLINHRHVVSLKLGCPTSIRLHPYYPPLTRVFPALHEQSRSKKEQVEMQW